MDCGCEERKEIMFTRGKPDVACVALLVGAPLLMYALGRLAR